MAMDAAVLALCCAELKQSLAGARIDKIFQPTRDEIVLQMRGKAGAIKLLLCFRVGSARISVTKESFENPQTAPSFCMLLRKYFSGARFLDILCPEGERIALLEFSSINEMGDVGKKTLAVELMGRYCNLVVVDEEGKIIEALKHIGFDDSAVRQLLPGLNYVLPEMQQGRLPLFSSTGEDIAARIVLADASLSSALSKNISGVGPLLLREIAFRAFGGKETLPSELGKEDVARLVAVIKELQQEYKNGGTPIIVINGEGVPSDFSFTQLTQYLPLYSVQEYSGYSVMLEAFYAQKDRVLRMQQKSKALRKTVKGLHERSLRKQAARQEELLKGEQSDYLRVHGELLTANLHSITKGAKEVTLNNWYTGEDVTISLEVRKTPSANAQHYFKMYKKLQTAVATLQELLQSGRYEIEYLQTVLYEIDAAENEQALEEIREELKTAGYLKSYKAKNKKQKAADFLRFTSSDGFAILVGRNNVQNEKLSVKTARGLDMWFHLRNAPGSHVVVMSEGEEIPDQTMEEAAMLAAFYSSQSASSKVAVDYTFVKNLRKTAGLPIGMVLYEKHKTAYVTPDIEIIDSLLKID